MSPTRNREEVLTARTLTVQFEGFKVRDSVSLSSTSHFGLSQKAFTITALVSRGCCTV